MVLNQVLVSGQNALSHLLTCYQLPACLLEAEIGSKQCTWYLVQATTAT